MSNTIYLGLALIAIGVVTAVALVGFIASSIA